MGLFHLGHCLFSFLILSVLSGGENSLCSFVLLVTLFILRKFTLFSSRFNILILGCRHFTAYFFHIFILTKPFSAFLLLQGEA